MAKDSYQIRLDDVFEGPMDLLVHLIKKNEVDICDIPISTITDQFLEYLKLMEVLNIDFAGDFLLMASTLTQIKSRSLLPVHGHESDEEDPRAEIIRPLIEYLQMRAAAEELAQRNILGQNMFVRHPDTREYRMEDSGEIRKIGLFELIDAFQKILENVAPDDRLEFTADKISVKDRISEIVDILEVQGSVTFSQLFPANPTKSDVIVTFLAILEMVKISLIRVIQHTHSGIMRILYL